MLKIAIVTNTLAPYRTPVFSRIGQTPDIQLHVFTCMEREPNRLWDYPSLDCDCTILRQRYIQLGQRYIHSNFDVISALARFGPDVIVTDGFNPTHLYAFAYAMFKRLPHVVLTDGTDLSERTLTGLHRAVRRLVYANSKAFVSASAGGQRLFDSYGLQSEQCFRSCLCIDNAAFFPGPHDQRKRFDFIVCGRIEAVKNPIFALDVACRVAQRLGRKTRILFVGSGSQEQRVKRAALLRVAHVEAEFAGFSAQQALPALYRSARLLLFPTLWEPWGVVTNEACAAGLPVIVSPCAGVVDELVREAENGFICELELNLWADRAAFLLTRPDVYRGFSKRGREIVAPYTFDAAAAGLIAACRFAGQAKLAATAPADPGAATTAPMPVLAPSISAAEKHRSDASAAQARAKVSQ